MFRSSNWFLYALITVGGLAVVYWVIVHGVALEAANHVGPHHAGGVGHWQQFKDTYHQNVSHPLAKLLLQIISIIAVARAFGFVFRKVGLPTVVGEIAAGIFLGPSFLALQFPGYSTFLFPPESLPNLQFLSQIGLILFMFVVGMELDLNLLRNRAQQAVLVSHASIVFPFTLGVGLSYFLYGKFVPQGIGFLPFALFMGIAMSITAFPVLARIVQERGLSRTRIGGLAITCAAVDDITAWCLLAAVIAIVKAGSIVSSIWTIALAAGYVAMMLGLVRPFLKKLGDVYADRESLSKPVVAVFFLILLLSSYATEVIGIHALFGAFLAGVIMPANVRFRSLFIDKVEDVALVLLLPLFFVFTGLRTQIGLLNDTGLWKWCGVIVCVAVAGKFLGSALPARLMRNTWRESLMLGALMNTRGLMELIVLNIGYDLGVLSPQIFAMMVIMALTTTVMTGPLLSLIDRFLPEAPPSAQQVEDLARKFRVLVPFGDPLRGRNMVRVATAFTKRNENAAVIALHLTPSEALHQFNVAEREREVFQYIRTEARRSELPVETLFKPSNDIDKDVTAIANSGGYDLAVIGVGRSIYEGTLLGRIVGITSRIIDPERLLSSLVGKEKLLKESVFDDRVRMLVREIKVPLGIYVDKDLASVGRVVVPLFTLSDSVLLAYAQKLMNNSGSHVHVLDAGNVFKQSPELMVTVKSMQDAAPGQMVVDQCDDLAVPLTAGYDLMLIGIDSWARAVESHANWLSKSPSVLIMRA